MAIEDLKKITKQLSEKISRTRTITTYDEHEMVMEMLEKLEKQKAAMENNEYKMFSIQVLQPSELTPEEEIAILEKRKKHCMAKGNFLEMKQIDRKLNALKKGKRKKK